MTAGRIGRFDRKAFAARAASAVTVALGSTLAPFAAQPAQAQSARDAQSDSAGLTRVENWLVFKRNLDGSEQWQFWPRLYVPFALPRGWTFTQRVDLPIAYTDSTGPRNPEGAWKAGINDGFVEEIFTTPEMAPGTHFIGSVRLVFPTGGSAPFGSRQYQVAPALGWVHTTADHALTFSPLARYFIGYHATSEAVAKVRTLDVFPTVTAALGDGWSLSLYSENPIVYDHVIRKWFVPIDVLLLKRVSRTIDFTFGGAYGLLKDAPQYRYIVNASLSVYFD